MILGSNSRKSRKYAEAGLRPDAEIRGKTGLMVQRKSSYKGLQQYIRKLKTPKIDVWRNQYSDKDYIITLENPEFTCVCPKTGLPDFANITIQYKPDKWCVELKSFKMYTLFYRNVGIFHEHVVNKMLEDFVKACKPMWVGIKGEFGVRGGIETTVSAEYNRGTYAEGG